MRVMGSLQRKGRGGRMGIGQDRRGWRLWTSRGLFLRVLPRRLVVPGELWHLVRWPIRYHELTCRPPRFIEVIANSRMGGKGASAATLSRCDH